ncbi:ATP-dependent zinc metalloprotease FTSH, chloroplastic, partial [Tanacetum coccineum]
MNMVKSFKVDQMNHQKSKVPCLVFIDELDVGGKQGGAGLEDGIDERKQTLHELLTEMEGFSGNKGIILLDTTSRPYNVLGSSLLRPEKFSMH